MLRAVLDCSAMSASAALLPDANAASKVALSLWSPHTYSPPPRETARLKLVGGFWLGWANSILQTCKAKGISARAGEALVQYLVPASCMILAPKLSQQQPSMADHISRPGESGRLEIAQVVHIVLGQPSLSSF